jgi:CheY-like chemotaxis protein
MAVLLFLLSPESTLKKSKTCLLVGRLLTMEGYAAEKLKTLERELIFLGLMDKAREIFNELGGKAALSYIKSSYHLLSKVYHPDLNPGKEGKAKDFQQRLNNASNLIKQTSDEALITLLKKGVHEEIHPKKKILVVEDEFGLQEMLRDVFLMEGYDVRIAVDGKDGYQAYLEFHPDLVFTDVIMPKMSGLDMIKKIRQKDKKIKVVYTSGFFGLQNVKRDLNEDVLRYGYHCLSKPYKISSMLELVDKYLNNQIGVNVFA